ncbi:hypothetical protein KAZ82_02405 [Candidatus Babeliales bacterium]|nr:hypothetical protein [Candidatus Babeliales bacterium]
MQNNSSIQQQSQAPVAHHLEEILVVQRSHLFKKIPAWHGISNQNTPEIMSIINQHVSFMPRAHAETNPEYKQIIPYLIFLVNEKIFVMQRKATASEQRLANKISIGIGGHIRQDDIADHNILQWANREFHEEVTYYGAQQLEILGILNDDTNDVGKVHMGVVILVRADSEKIFIKDEHKSGILLTKKECLQNTAAMESWSQLCLQFLIDHKIF